MLILKGCPKCGGDLSEGKDQYGKFLNCLQCGYLKDLADSELADILETPATAPFEEPVAAGEKRKAA